MLPSCPEPALRLCDFQPGSHFNGLILVLAEKKQRTTHNGASFLTLKLRDCTGSANARWFSPPLGSWESLENARLVRVSGMVDDTPGYRGDLKLKLCEPFPEPEDLSPFLSPLPAAHAQHRARFLDLIRSVQNLDLKALLKQIFALDGNIWPRFQDAPAAKSMHHAYRGGLLEHSGEVATMCDRIAASLPHLDRDLLVCAALLHDIGKLEEMESDLGASEYTASGHLVGHIVLGACTVACAADGLPDFPAHLKHELMHLILSHHGRTEHGAAKTPMCAEAVILSSCDLMSAKVAQIRSASESDNDAFPKLYGWHEREPNGIAYLGAMRRVLQLEKQERE